MEWLPDDSLRALADAVAREDNYLVRQLREALIAYIRRSRAPYDAQAALKILDILRSSRDFDALKVVARAFFERGQSAPALRRHYAQALIEEDAFDDAERWLNELVAETATEDRFENCEARGLLGRLCKQRYVNDAKDGASNAADLTRAIGFYLDVYREAPDTNLWHGINVVALLKRAEVDGVTVPDVEDADSIARRLLQQVEAKSARGQAESWDLATAMEACVALGASEQAVEWLKRYIADVETRSHGLERADAFEFKLTGTLRQLEEVWRLNAGRGPGASLIPLLKAVTLRAKNGTFSGTPEDLRSALDRTSWEARFGPERWVTLEWWETGKNRAGRVARISHRDTNKTKGTGFLVSGNAIGRFGDEVFLLTNSHVVSERDDVRNDRRYSPLRLNEVRIDFQALSRRRPFYGRAVIWESPPWDEDVTMIALDTQPAIKTDAYPVFAEPLGVGGMESIFVIGYPEGTTQLQLSFENNRLLEMNDKYLRYLTPTAKGSSGSPLFDSNWRLVGIHHSKVEDIESFSAPGTTLSANEGVWIKRIQLAIQNATAAT